MYKTAKQMRKEQDEKAKALPIETKRTFWKAMLDGKSLGEASEIAGIDDVSVAAALTLQSYHTIHIPKSLDEIV